MEINPYSRELSPSSTLHRLTPSYVRHASKSHFSGPMRFQEAKPIDRQTTKGYVEMLSQQVLLHAKNDHVLVKRKKEDRRRDVMTK